MAYSYSALPAVSAPPSYLCKQDILTYTPAPKADPSKSLLRSIFETNGAEHYLTVNLQAQHALVSNMLRRIPLMLPNSGTRGLSNR
jgi:hypothetical protein